MNKKYFIHVFYFIYWLIYFVISKALFLLYHYQKSASLSVSDILKVFIHGLSLDMSFSGYISVLPFLCFLLGPLFKVNLQKLVTGYTIALVFILNFLTVADLEIYNAWGFRLDGTALQYFNTPAEMMASVSSSPLILLLIIYIFLTLFFNWLYNRVFKRNVLPASDRSPLRVSISVILLALLFVPIRGGFQQIPINQSDVYFSDKIFANHAAVNVPWNVMHSLFRRSFNRHNPYEYMSGAEGKHLLDSLYSHGTTPPLSVLSTQRPNILFIILESYTAKLVGCLGGEPGVTPNLDRIAGEGLLFTNIYASGERSEKGLVALLSGYPTQTTTSIITTPSKTEALPHLNKILTQQGYHSAYYYGGELNFANIKSYLLNAGYNKLISKYDFDKSQYNSKWGVHDHLLLQRFINDLSKEKQPFFYTLFTLSSHEPYDVPMPAKFIGNDATTKFKNSFFYTDQSIGRFIENAKKQSWWSNTLVVMAADHGHPLPGGDPNYKASKYRIPLIFTGGALKVKGRVNTIGSQTDVAYTLLQQIGLDNSAFKWSKNLLDTTARQFAFYAFNDGFGFVSPGGVVNFDNVSRQIIYKDSNVNASQLNAGKAYMQLSFADFLNRR